jgi:hypothetical protein
MNETELLVSAKIAHTRKKAAGYYAIALLVKVLPSSYEKKRRPPLSLTSSEGTAAVPGRGEARVVCAEGSFLGRQPIANHCNY